jgi:hypothetical protein
MGDLLKAKGGDAEEALYALEDALRARKPRDYVGGIIRNWKQEHESAKAATNGTPTDEPEIIREARREGAMVERLRNKQTGAVEFKAYGRYYNLQGEEIGW